MKLKLRIALTVGVLVFLFGFSWLLSRITVVMILTMLFSFFLTSDASMKLLFFNELRANHKKVVDKVVWITGASSGIGESLAYELTRMGAQVIISARRRERLEIVKTNAKGAHAPFIVPMDVLNEEDQEKAIKLIMEQFGKIDILVRNLYTCTYIHGFITYK